MVCAAAMRQWKEMQRSFVEVVRVGTLAMVEAAVRERPDAVNQPAFGQDVILIPDGEEHFTVTIPVVLSPQFFGWLFGLEGGLTLIAPRQAVEEYRRKLSAALDPGAEM